MPWLVDGDNLLGSWPGWERSAEGRRQLARLLDQWSRACGRRVMVVFDGPGPPGVGVVHSGAGRSADEWIVGFLRRQNQPRTWRVVTSDRSLAERARALGAETEPSHRFRARLSEAVARQDREDDKPRGPVSVAEWLRYFGLDDDPASR